MSLNLYSPLGVGRRGMWNPNLMDDFNRELQSFNEFAPYWRGSHLENIMGVGDTSMEVVDDDNKFAVALDVSHFRPEELKVNLEGNLLTIEGSHEQKTRNGYIQRNFTRKWTLPEDCNFSDIRSNLSPDGHLSIEAPKVPTSSTARTIPILPGPPKKQQLEKKDEQAK